MTAAELDKVRKTLVTDVGYANARLRAMRTRLLRPAQVKVAKIENAVEN